VSEASEKQAALAAYFSEQMNGGSETDVSPVPPNKNTTAGGFFVWSELRRELRFLRSKNEFGGVSEASEKQAALAAYFSEQMNGGSETDVSPVPPNKNTTAGGIFSWS
jgi:hypothetical protein